MNVNKFKKLLVMNTTRYFSWSDDSQGNNQVARLTTGIGVKNLDDDVSLTLTYIENGVLIITFTFDSLEPTADNLLLVNNFNANVTGMKASIEQRGRKQYLIINVECINPLDEEGALNFFIMNMNKINDESTLRYLEPLTVITK